MLSNVEKHKDVYYVTKKQEEFSSTYIDVREKEERVYTDKVVKELPVIAKAHHYYKEWKLRQKSTKRIIEYLIAKNESLKILDLGCGNGWFSNQLSQIPSSEIFAVDVNALELEQAARVFKKSNLKFIYADIFSSKMDILQDFDIITVNSCFQYFENSKKTLNRLKEKLKPDGELHIVDSPFYKASEIKEAKERTRIYYENIGVPEMTNNYFHHKVECLRGFEILYQPKKNITKRILGKKDSPFMWLKWIKNSD